MQFTFGKYAGLPLSAVESSYLCYALDHFNLPDLLVQQCKAELLRRYGLLSGPVAPQPAEPENCRERLKLTYRKLALKHHPDRGGSDAAMQAINEFYETLTR